MTDSSRFENRAYIRIMWTCLVGAVLATGGVAALIVSGIGEGAGVPAGSMALAIMCILTIVFTIREVRRRPH